MTAVFGWNDPKTEFLNSVVCAGRSSVVFLHRLRRQVLSPRPLLLFHPPLTLPMYLPPIPSTSSLACHLLLGSNPSKTSSVRQNACHLSPRRSRSNLTDIFIMIVFIIIHNCCYFYPKDCNCTKFQFRRGWWCTKLNLVLDTGLLNCCYFKIVQCQDFESTVSFQNPHWVCAIHSFYSPPFDTFQLNFSLSPYLIIVWLSDEEQ